jgi:hypothetical protein
MRNDQIILTGPSEADRTEPPVSGVMAMNRIRIGLLALLVALAAAACDATDVTGTRGPTYGEGPTMGSGI